MRKGKKAGDSAGRGVVALEGRRETLENTSDLGVVGGDQGRTTLTYRHSSVLGSPPDSGGLPADPGPDNTCLDVRKAHPVAPTVTEAIIQEQKMSLRPWVFLIHRR